MTTSLIDTKAAAERIGVSVATLKRLVEGGKIAFIDVGTRKRRVHRFSEDHLQSFMKRHEIREAPNSTASQTSREVSAAGRLVTARASKERLGEGDGQTLS